MPRLEGEVAIVTGAAQSIGSAIADALDGEGAHVARTGLSRTPIVLDVRDRVSIEAAVDEVERTLGTPTILVNNAAVNRIGPAESLSEEDWATVLDVNLNGVFRVLPDRRPPHARGRARGDRERRLRHGRRGRRSRSARRTGRARRESSG